MDKKKAARLLLAGTAVSLCLGLSYLELSAAGSKSGGSMVSEDDLTTGSINPYELYLIYTELVAGEDDGLAGNVAYMIDESHTLKNKIAEMIQSLIALQTAYAKALLVSRPALLRARAI